MKRKDILTQVYDQSGRYVSAVGRNTEILERTVKEIEKQTGVKLKQPKARGGKSSPQEDI